MTTDAVDFDTAWELGLGLPRATKTRYYRMPALEVGGKMFACRAGHRSAERNSLILTVGFERREKLRAKDPAVYYVKPHYEPYPVVLARLRRIDRAELKRVLRLAHRAVSTGRVDPDRPEPRTPRARRTAAKAPARTRPTSRARRSS